MQLMKLKPPILRGWKGPIGIEDAMGDDVVIVVIVLGVLVTALELSGEIPDENEQPLEEEMIVAGNTDEEANADKAGKLDEIGVGELPATDEDVVPMPLDAESDVPDAAIEVPLVLPGPVDVV
jgi:hypothetical protein